MTNSSIQKRPEPVMKDTFDGFRLPKSVPSVAELYRCETESVASSAPSKHRIDLLFNEARSVTSECQPNRSHYQSQRKARSLVEGTVEEEKEHLLPDANPKNYVQVRIEKMFSDVSSSEQDLNNTSLTNKKFPVTHLGSMHVTCKITSIDGLQNPLRELFLKYCIQKKKPSVGFVQISDKGLFIEYESNYGGKIEKLNPFSTIAIWASLKVSHRITSAGTECAFPPIVTNSDDTSLYHRVDDDVVEHLIRYKDTPLFVVVMRDPDIPNRQLVCHGFVCDSADDAVVMAASLYRVLISKLGKNRVLKNINQKWSSKLPISNKLSSIGETSANENEADYTEVSKPMSPTTPPPSRPPRKAKEPAKSKPDTGKSIEGDILTKVAIPGSSSFLNTKRLGYRPESFKRDKLEIGQQNSNLGFIEMFNELQSQEGLKTIDEILNVIIKAEGMSFNELKPIYKEFLLKLALVLSKDELYHRSKSIIKLQKQENVSKLKKVISAKNGLMNVLRVPLTKFSNKSAPCSCREANIKVHSDGTSTDSFFLTGNPKPEPKPPRHTKSARHKTFRFRSQRMISTSEDSDYPNVNHWKYKSKMKDDALRPSSSGYFSFSECSYDTDSCTCTSADKCYCSLSKDKIRKSETATMFSACSCETLECRKRNKCYCHKTKKLSLVEQLKQKGFAISESSLSPDDTHKTTCTKDKSNAKLSKSLEYLESSKKKFKNRMELYERDQKVYPCKHRMYKYSPSYSSASSKASQKRSSSSDNLAVDYSMFATKLEEQRKTKISEESVYRAKRAMNKPNVVYAELACPQMATGRFFNRNYSLMPILPKTEAPVQTALYPHSSVRSCNCACTCPIHTGEVFPSFHNSSKLGSTPFHRINMENIFGYYP